MEKNIILIAHGHRNHIHIKLRDAFLLMLFDGFKNKRNNEDPYIFSGIFLYSFCQTYSSITKDILDKKPIYVFMSKNKENNYMIDTIIEADKFIKWPSRGDRTKEKLKNFFEKSFEKNVDIEDIIDYHLPEITEANGLSEHDKITIRTCIGDKNNSYLPLVKYGDNYKPFTFNEKLSEKIQNLFKTKKNKGNYVVKKNSPRIDSCENKMKDYIDVIGYIDSKVLSSDEVYKINATKINTLYSELKKFRGKKGIIELEFDLSINEL